MHLLVGSLIYILDWLCRCCVHFCHFKSLSSLIGWDLRTNQSRKSVYLGFLRHPTAKPAGPHANSLSSIQHLRFCGAAFGINRGVHLKPHASWCYKYLEGRRSHQKMLSRWDKIKALYASIASTMTPKQVHYMTDVAQKWCWLVPTVNFQQHAGTHARMYARTHTHTHTRRPFFSFHPFIPPFLPAYLFLHLSRPFTTRRPLSSHRKKNSPPY